MATPTSFSGTCRGRGRAPKSFRAPLRGDSSANSWSPDGERLAGWVESGTFRIAVFSLVSQEYRVFPVPGAEPVWLNDNRRLLYRGDGGKVLLLDTKTGNSHEILSVRFDNFALSRDERTIYFSRIRSEADIWMVTLDENAP